MIYERYSMFPFGSLLFRRMTLNYPRRFYGPRIKSFSVMLSDFRETDIFDVLNETRGYELENNGLKYFFGFFSSTVYNNKYDYKRI